MGRLSISYPTFVGAFFDLAASHGMESVGTRCLLSWPGPAARGSILACLQTQGMNDRCLLVLAH